MDGPGEVRGSLAGAAPAKINLSLHVVARRADGYHLLDGLVAFTALGDELTLVEAAEDGLEIVGPMAGALHGHANILGRALVAARDAAARAGHPIPRLHLRLTKNLPVAAGIGGGSADAAALLRLLAMRRPVLRDALYDTAPSLGADVPMCLDHQPVRITGIGDRIAPIPRAPALPIVLVNPGVPLSTPAVFAALVDPSFEAPPAIPSGGFASFEAVASYLDGCRNDLEAPARFLVPAIGDVLDGLRRAGARIARMSGSGATCFGLFETSAAAEAARATITAARPHWFVAGTTTYARETEAPSR